MGWKSKNLLIDNRSFQRKRSRNQNIKPEPFGSVVEKPQGGSNSLCACRNEDPHRQRKWVGLWSCGWNFAKCKTRCDKIVSLQIKKTCFLIPFLKLHNLYSQIAKVACKNLVKFTLATILSIEKFSKCIAVSCRTQRAFAMNTRFQFSLKLSPWLIKNNLMITFCLF